MIRVSRAWVRRLRGATIALMLLVLCACGPKAALLMGMLPDGTVSTLLGNLQGMEEGNQRSVAKLEAAGNWNELAKLAEENLAKDTNSADWWLIAGYAHAQAGRHPLAIEAYNQRVRLAPDDLMGWEFLAKSYRASGQPLRAAQALNNAHLARQGTPETWLLLGECYSDLNRDLPAAAAYREAIQLNGELAEAWFGLGRAYARLGRRPEFEQTLKALEKLNPELAKELAQLRPPQR